MNGGRSTELLVEALQAMTSSAPAVRGAPVPPKPFLWLRRRGPGLPGARVIVLKRAPWIRRVLDALAPRRGIVTYCARCHCPLMNDPEMRRRSARRCSSWTGCDGQIDIAGPGEPPRIICLHLTVVWS